MNILNYKISDIVLNGILLVLIAFVFRPVAALEVTLYKYWYIAILFFLILLCKDFIYPKIGFIASITIFYFLKSASMVWELLENRYSSVEELGKFQLKLASADSAAKLLIILVPLIYLCNNKNFRKWGEYGALGFVLFNIAYIVLYQLPFSRLHCSIHNSCFGILGNPSMNECIMVAALPVIHNIMGKKQWYAVCALTLFTAIVAKTSLATGMFALMIFSYISIGQYKKLLPLSLIPLLIGVLYKGQEFFYSRGRLPAIEFFMGHWFQNKANWIEGMGFGTFAVFASGLQKDFNWQPHEIWLWPHSDWVEIAFVCGFLGLGLCLLTYGTAIYNLIKRHDIHIAISLILYGVAMMANYPNHLALSATFGAWLMIIGLRRNDAQD